MEKLREEKRVNKKNINKMNVKYPLYNILN